MREAAIHTDENLRKNKNVRFGQILSSKEMEGHLSRILCLIA